MKTMGSLFKEARLKKGITLKELAKEADLTESYLSLLENDKRNPSKKVMKKLRILLDIDATELFVVEFGGMDMVNDKSHVNNLDEFLESFDLTKERAKRHVKLEDLLSDDTTADTKFYYKSVQLSGKNKQSILKVLDVVFESFDELEGNYPSLTEFKWELEKERSMELYDEKMAYLDDLLDKGIISEEEYENINVDEIGEEEL